MVEITLQRHDYKTINNIDTVRFDENHIIINNRIYQFPQGNNLDFLSPDEQITSARRDENGILHAKVTRQYNVLAKDEVENNPEKYIKSDPMLRLNARVMPIIAEELIEDVKEQTVAELLAFKKQELSQLRE